MSSTQG
jgi:hypothetical protein